MFKRWIAVIVPTLKSTTGVPKYKMAGVMVTRPAGRASARTWDG